LSEHQTPLDLVRLRPVDGPVACARPDRLAVASRWFQAHFPGEVLYAVKANPSPWVIDTLYAAGHRWFDVASLPEVELIASRCPEATMAFMELRESQMSNDNPAVASSRAFLARVLIEHLGEAREGLDLYRAASNGLIEGIEMRAGTAAEEGVDGVEFAQKDAFFTAHLEALWTNAHAN